jgi:hypothetical protein
MIDLKVRLEQLPQRLYVIMERILCSLCGERLPTDKRHRERNGRTRHAQKWEAFKRGEAAFGGFWITRACL